MCIIQVCRIGGNYIIMYCIRLPDRERLHYDVWHRSVEQERCTLLCITQVCQTIKVYTIICEYNPYEILCITYICHTWIVHTIVYYIGLPDSESLHYYVQTKLTLLCSTYVCQTRKVYTNMCEYNPYEHIVYYIYLPDREGLHYYVSHISVGQKKKDAIMYYIGLLDGESVHYCVVLTSSKRVKLLFHPSACIAFWLKNFRAYILILMLNTYCTFSFHVRT